MSNTELKWTLKQIVSRLDSLAHVVREMEDLIPEERRREGSGVKDALNAIQGSLAQTTDKVLDRA